MSGNGSGVCTNGTVVPTTHCQTPGQGVLGTWDLTGQPGTQTSNAASSSLSGVVTAPLSRAPALMPSPGTNSISASNWTTSSQPDPGSYYTLSLTAPTGCTLSVSAVALDVRSSTTGPTSAGLATSQDEFAQPVSVSTSVPGEIPVEINSVSTIELRILGYGASAMTGTMRIQNQLEVRGSVQ
jgi:hypothetical protein